MPREAGGQRRPHERDLNNNVPIIGTNVYVLEVHSVSVWLTEAKEMLMKNKHPRSLTAVGCNIGSAKHYSSPVELAPCWI